MGFIAKTRRHMGGVLNGTPDLDQAGTEDVEMDCNDAQKYQPKLRRP
jgi:hypothetical protein